MRTPTSMSHLSLFDVLKGQEGEKEIADVWDEIKTQVTYAAMVANPKDFGLRLDDLRYLDGPLVLHPGGWDIGILRAMIPPARIAQVQMRDAPEYELCSLVEALAYFSTMSMVGPLTSEYADIMFWLCQEILDSPTRPQRIYEMLGFSKPVRLSDYQRKYILNDLRRDIRQSVIKHARAKGLWLNKK